MNDQATLPASITQYETEAAYTDPELDYAYIDGVASDISYALRRGASAETAYQPGDGTRYGLVLAPLATLVRVRPRIVDGRAWDSAAVSGMSGGPQPGDTIETLNLRPYDQNGYLLSWLEHASYPIRLGDRHNILAASYIEEHWKTTTTSAVSIALLLRAISWHLDNKPLRAVV